MRRVNRYFVRYRVDKNGVYYSVISIESPEELTGLAFIRKVLDELKLEVYKQQLIAVEDKDIDILALGLVDNTIHIEM